MKYYYLYPDFVESGIKDEKGIYIDLDNLNISKDLIYRINQYNSRVKNLIPLGEKMKSRFMDDIYKIDLEGYNLSLELQKQLNVKVRYYSEGLNSELFEAPKKENYKLKKGLMTFLSKIFVKI